MYFQGGPQGHKNAVLGLFSYLFTCVLFIFSREQSRVVAYPGSSFWLKIGPKQPCCGLEDHPGNAFYP